MNITNELLAAYADGNVSQEEREIIRQYLTANPDMMESVIFAMSDEEEYKTKDIYLNNLNDMLEKIDKDHVNPPSSKLQETAMAAQNDTDNLCVIRCEGIALRHFGHNISDEELLRESKAEGWLQSSGTSFKDIGKLSLKHGLQVSHFENSNIESLQEKLTKGYIVMTFIDEGELTGDYVQERDEDQFIGGCPDHVVIVKNVTDKNIEIIDSYTPEQLDTYPLDQFFDAWNDSNNYMVVITK